MSSANETYYNISVKSLNPSCNLFVIFMGCKKAYYYKVKKVIALKICFISQTVYCLFVLMINGQNGDQQNGDIMTANSRT